MIEEAIWKLWPYFERAGVVSAVILSVWLFFTMKENKALRARIDTIQEQRVAETLKVTSVIEQNTAATKAQADLIQNLIFMDGRKA